MGRERPILFSGEMVKAILDGRKSQTRRVCKLPVGFILDLPPEMEPSERRCFFGNSTTMGKFPIRMPYVSGDRLWVRETWCQEWQDPGGWTGRALYRADGQNVIHVDDASRSPWRPSIHMPRWASRITLEITNLRVERLQDITEEDAVAEGAETSRCGQYGYKMEPVYSHRTGFVRLWERINGEKHPWASNPWCWVIEFRRLP